MGKLGTRAVALIEGLDRLPGKVSGTTDCCLSRLCVRRLSSKFALSPPTLLSSTCVVVRVSLIYVGNVFYWKRRAFSAVFFAGRV